MPPDLGRPFPADYSLQPPHMAVTDWPIWQRARVRLSLGVSEWYFDVAVGEGMPLADSIPDEMRPGLMRLSRKRIDAVGRGAGYWLLVEVRPNAGLGALGHIRSYRALWERDPPDTWPVRAVLVSDRAEPDVVRTAVNDSIAMLTV